MTMCREQVLDQIAEIQALFPSELVQSLRFNAIGPDDLDELLARALTVFSPVFLPLFERNGDLWAVHVRPSVSWQEGIWVMLPHDAAEPLTVASCLRYLPAGLLIPPHVPPRMLDALWDALGTFVERIPGAVRPEKEPFVGAVGPVPALRARFDPLDGAAHAAAISRGGPEEQARTEAERLLAEMPDDPYVLTINAVLRSRLGYGDPGEPALRVLPQEIPLGLSYGTIWLLAESAPELLEVARKHAAPGIPEDSPLAPLRSAAYTEARTASVLRPIAGKYHDQGDETTALNQLRNGAAVAAWTQTLDAGWCSALAEQADRVEPGCTSAALARLAAEVIDQGP